MVMEEKRRTVNSKFQKKSKILRKMLKSVQQLKTT